MCKYTSPCRMYCVPLSPQTPLQQLIQLRDSVAEAKVM